MMFIGHSQIIFGKFIIDADLNVWSKFFVSLTSHPTQQKVCLLRLNF